jgi:hypothetical protein
MQRKQFLRYFGAIVGGVAVGPLITGCGGGTAEDTLVPTADSATAVSTSTTVPTGTAGTLSAEEIAGLKFMREEEKLAHDVYATLYVRWGAQVFSNIAASETEHTEAVLGRLIAYGIEDPAAGNDTGEFENAQLQAMYDALVAAGAASLVEALKVGALIEETDIRDIVEKMSVTDEADILGVYENLLCGSRNHLRAFNAALLDQGVTYVSQVITQQEWDAIAYAARETCGG